MIFVYYFIICCGSADLSSSPPRASDRARHSRPRNSVWNVLPRESRSAFARALGVSLEDAIGFVRDLEAVAVDVCSRSRGRPSEDAGPDSNNAKTCSLPTVAARVFSRSNPPGDASPREIARRNMRGTGFEPKETSPRSVSRARIRPCSFAHCVRSVRGTGFEPADPYGTAS